MYLIRWKTNECEGENDIIIYAQLLCHLPIYSSVPIVRKSVLVPDNIPNLFSWLFLIHKINIFYIIFLYIK